MDESTSKSQERVSKMVDGSCAVGFPSCTVQQTSVVCTQIPLIVTGWRTRLKTVLYVRKLKLNKNYTEPFRFRADGTRLSPENVERQLSDAFVVRISSGVLIVFISGRLSLVSMTTLNCFVI